MTDRRASTIVPSYRRHKPTGQAVVTLLGRDHYLGKFGSAASREKYARLIAEWLDRGKNGSGLALQQSSAPTVDHLLLAYARHAIDYYADSPAEIEKIKLSLRLVRRLYGNQPA